MADAREAADSGAADAAPRRRVRFSITLKLIATMVALVLLIAGGFTGTDIVSTQEQYAGFARDRRAAEVDNVRTRGLAAARNLSSTLYAPLLNGDIGLVQDAIESLTKADSDIVRAQVVRPDGRIVASSVPGALGQQLDAALLTRLKALDEARQLDEVGATLPAEIGFGAPIQIALPHGKVRREGFLSVDASTTKVVEVLSRIESDRKAAVRAALLRTLALGGLALLIGAVIAILQGFRFGSAIRSLMAVAEEVGAGNLEARATPTTNDELGVLGDRFNQMTGQIQVLLSESVAKAAIDQELERATEIQQQMMPARSELRSGSLSYYGYCEPATQVGGDWWHHYQLDADRTLLCIGDVTGHGIPSAMLTASTKAACDTAIFENPRVEPARLLTILDHAIRESGKGELVMTFFAALFDTARMTVEFANAGHNFPVVVQDGKLTSLIARGARLGDGGEYVCASAPLTPGERILLYTDGLIECQNGDGEEYGMRRMRRLLRKAASDSPAGLVDRLVKEAFAFYAGTPPDDDITLVVCDLA